MTSGYLLVLLALQGRQASYVAPARELGIVFGPIPGSVLLKEGAASQRLAGSAIIVLGVLALDHAVTATGYRPCCRSSRWVQPGRLMLASSPYTTFLGTKLVAVSDRLYGDSPSRTMCPLPSLNR